MRGLTGGLLFHLQRDIVGQEPLNAKSYLNGDGSLESDTAVSSMVSDWNTTGRSLYFPTGEYKINPGLLVARRDGLSIFGAGTEDTKLTLAADGILLDFSGTDTGHRRRYLSVSDLTLYGNDKQGALVRAYHATTLNMERVLHFGINGYGLDAVELWDSTFLKVDWEWCYSTTQYSVSLRNSAAVSGFGASSDSCNAVRFYGCRFESFKAGAVSIAAGTSNTASPHDITFAGLKCESVQARGPFVTVDAFSRDIKFSQVYLFVGGFDSGYSTKFSVMQIFGPAVLRDVFIGTGGDFVSQGVELWADNCRLDSVVGIYSTTPSSGAHVHITGGTNNLSASGVATNSGTAISGTPASSESMNFRHLAINPTMSAAPSASAGAQAGTSPPAPVVAASSRDVRGSATFGTGGSATAGELCVIDFNSSYAIPPVVVISPANAATAALLPYVAGADETGFGVSTQVAPSSSQAATKYAFNWAVIG